MNETKREPAYRTMPAVAALNRVQGFDPTRFIRIAKGGGLVLDLKYKKLWFRLACPDGVIKPVTLKITEQVAIIEARVFRSKNDAEPISSFISTKYAAGNGGKLYIEAAQYEAEDQALVDAGFGVQFCDISGGTSMDRLVANDTITGANTPQAAIGQPVAEKAPATEQPQPGGQTQAPPVVTQPQTVPQSIAAQLSAGIPRPATQQPMTVAAPVSVQAPVMEQAISTAAIPAVPVMTEAPLAAQPPISAPVIQPPMAVQAPAAEQPAPTTIPVKTQPAAHPAPAPVLQQPVTAQSVQAPITEPAPVVLPPQMIQTPAAEAVPGGVAVQFPSVTEPVTAQSYPTAGIPLPYSTDMPVETICGQMTREEALAVEVDAGICKGWTLAEVLEKRPASLKWYLNGYTGGNNIIRAGARILLDRGTAQLAAG